MSVYNLLKVITVCPRCGVESEVDADFRFGLRDLTEYRIGDKLDWEGEGVRTPNKRPEGGNYDGEAYAVCPHCQRDFWLSISVRSDIIVSAEVDPTREPQIPGEPLPSEGARGKQGMLRELAGFFEERWSPVKIDWVKIPAGEFIFGLSVAEAEELLNKLPQKSARDRERVLRETPERVVRLEAFYISRFPITNRQYLEFAESNHWYSDRSLFFGQDQVTVLGNLRHLAETNGEHPVCGLGWHNALAFCNWIGVRLPTSAEWEKAARGTDGRLYPWGSEWDVSRGNFVLDRNQWPNKTSPVDAYPSGQSPYGVLDMMGNTYEYTRSTAVDSSELAICRGCSCDFDPEIHTPDWFRNRVTAVVLHSMNLGVHLAGFRPVLDKWYSKMWAGF